jgi:Ca-activated chloride channel family protein
LRRTVSNLIADGSTSLYDATERGLAEVEALADDSRINAVVVLSDGQDTTSKLKLKRLLERLNARADRRRQIRIFTIAYGGDADQKVLERIANASGGKPYVGDPKEIEKVYIQISSFF